MSLPFYHPCSECKYCTLKDEEMFCKWRKAEINGLVTEQSCDDWKKDQNGYWTYEWIRIEP